MLLSNDLGESMNSEDANRSDLSRAVFTIAVGKPIFLDMAIALARSFLRWNALSNIGFAIVTDKPREQCPQDLKSIQWIQVPVGKYGTGFTPKLYLDEMAPAKRSLFIDADCLCVRSLDEVFDKFSGHAVSVVGTNRRSGEWFGDVAAICKVLGLRHYPYFNGGVYYLEPGPVATAVFQQARAYCERYDEIGFVRLRDRENDEVLIATAMAGHGLDPVDEDGTIMNTLMDAEGGMNLDVLSGEAVLYNPQDHPKKARGHSLEVLRPAIMHLNDMDIARHPYRTQVMMLNLATRGWPENLARIFASVFSAAPAIVMRYVARVARPLIHGTLGPRSVKPTLR